MKKNVLCIIIAVKDDDRLQGTIESLNIFQERGDVEIVIVDSSSKPISVKEWADSSLNIRVRRQEPNGIYEAMNAGLEVCNSEWCYFLNCGDYIRLAPQLLINDLRKASDGPQSVEIVSYSYVKDSTMRRWRGIRSRMYLYLTYGAACHQAVVYRADTLIALGGFEGKYKYLADRVSILKILRQYGSSSIAIKNRVLCDWETEGTCTYNLEAFNEECRAYRRNNFHLIELVIGYFYTKIIDQVAGS